MRSALAALGQARAEIDALNVYPVPDADTGTNLYLTVEAVLAALDAEPPDDPVLDEPAAALRAAVRAALLGARGNSGVILSQLIRGAAESLVAAGRPPAELARLALRDASRAARAAVAAPVEGTILSVADAAADAAAACPGDDPIAVLAAAVSAAHDALARTPDQMLALRVAGVVDSGGRGLVVLLDSLLGSVSGVVGAAVTAREEARPAALPRPTHELPPVGGPAFEVMYLLDATDEDVAVLRAELAELGESLLVVGGDGLWNVHVHVDDAGAALEAGVRAGRPHRIAVTHFGDQRARSEGVVLESGARRSSRARRRGRVGRPRHDRAARGRPAHWWSPRRPGAGRRAQSCWTPYGVPGPPRSSCSRTTATSCRSPRRPRKARGPRASGSPSSPRPPRCRCSRRWPSTTPGDASTRTWSR